MAVALSLGAFLLAPLLSGCGDDGDRESSYAGSYSGNATLDNGQTGRVELNVADDGRTTGSLVVQSTARGPRIALPPSAVSLAGTTDPSTGAYSVTGTYTSGGQTHTVRVTGTLPTPSRAGTMTIEVGGQSFSGNFTPPPPTATRTSAIPPTATRTTAANPTATNTSGPTHTPGGPTTTPTTTPTPTHTPGGATATATPGIIQGVDSRLLGTWSGTARNESTGVQKQVRIRIALEGASVRVTDLNGNLYKTSPATVTMTSPTPTSLLFNSTGSLIIAFNLTLQSSNNVFGIYQATTPAIPPVLDAVGLTLTRES